MLENNKTILTYNLSEDEGLVIRKVFETLNLFEIKEIEKSMANMQISDIVSGLKIETLDSYLPEVKIVLFNNLTDEEINSAVLAVRNNLKEKPILAVVTPTSENWTFKFLVEHLIEENKWTEIRK